MEVILSMEAMQLRALELKKTGSTVGFVPTMGYLHEGHLSLIRQAREQCDVLVVSIFVNPAQFGPNEDLETYPRDFARDENLCRQEDADILFCPDAGSMYADDASVWVDEEALSEILCGASRPGHFRGVCTVVAKLFNLVLPDLAVFGEKDAQQLRVIERMVRDLNFPVRILRGPIVREPDGLAMSSRNRTLSENQRKDACCLRKALDRAKELCAAGERDLAVIRQAMLQILDSVPDASVDYLEFVDDRTLRPVERCENKTLTAVAVRIGSTRLIDNEILSP